MSEAYKVCPICEAHNHRNAAICVTCGTTIVEVPLREQSETERDRSSRYDYRLGETDLAEESLSFKGRVLSIALLLIVIVIAAGIALTLLAPGLQDGQIAQDVATPASTPTRVAGPSVTAGPPTATFTASPIPTQTPTNTDTPAPCVREVAPGDSLIAIVTRCGHRSLDVLPTVMAINGITDETRIQIGQQIIVPHPSPTPNPAATAPPAAEAGSDNASAEGGSRTDVVTLLAFDPFAPTETPTLLPGLMWHVVQRDENMITVAIQFKTNAKTLSDINPEIEFFLCDFGLAYGGPECTVQLGQGQLMRVPAPTPTMTLIPTASGSETPTPLPTATFNAPIAQSPSDQAIFSPLQQVTLRWVATGRLAQDDVYRLMVTNAETGENFTADTRELFFIVPAEWQAKDADLHSYTWQVTVVDTRANIASHTTEARTFLWQGSGEGASS